MCGIINEVNVGLVELGGCWSAWTQLSKGSFSMLYFCMTLDGKLGILSNGTDILESNMIPGLHVICLGLIYLPG